MKGDFVVESFLNYGSQDRPRLLMREDEASRKNRRDVRVPNLNKTRLRECGISATAIIPAGTRCEPAGLEGEAVRQVLYQMFEGLIPVLRWKRWKRRRLGGQARHMKCFHRPGQTRLQNGWPPTSDDWVWANMGGLRHRNVTTKINQRIFVADKGFSGRHVCSKRSQLVMGGLPIAPGGSS